MEKYTSQNESYLQLKVHTFLGPESVGNIREKQLEKDLEMDKSRGEKGKVNCKDSLMPRFNLSLTILLK